MANARKVVGTIIYWIAILLALFGVVSTLMSLALYEGDERLWASVNWAAFTIAAWLVAFAVRKVLLR